MALAAEKQVAEALSLQKRAVALMPAEKNLRMNLARIALQAGDKALARNELDLLSAEGTKLPFHAEVTRLRQSI